MAYDQDQLAAADTDFSLASTAKEEYQYDEGMRVYPHRIGMKQGHKFCGGCCDMRRAVIIVNIVNASLLALGFLSILTIAGASSLGATDDDLEEAIVGFDDAGIIVVLAVTAAKILFSFIGMYGAFRFDIFMVGACFAVYVVESLFAILTLNIAGLVYSAFFAYPHYFFVIEVQHGIMTPENYPINEEHSCCCV
ncbi:hypothetical protein FisN_22Lh221 [Fistulifera solaris]|uniref:Uncharacterized protein n=1 Tax=Fistulifera solaris TaxID=1519565 RepID=A0A1Z5JC38_FISSO|nr:hypothetical protein FisN_22Lh221 [Fistulifera solaris]|eukprot:GAX11529.1 hypothetical protein FisN_22Lh221 [Fistulifera solaris]